MKKISIRGGGIVASNFIKEIIESDYILYKYFPTSIFSHFNQLAIDTCRDKKIKISSNLKDLSNSDLIISAGNYLLLEKEFLENNHVINFHAAPLPKYGGSAGPSFSLINNEKKYGFTYQKMINLLDAGPIIFQGNFDIGDDMTAFDLDNKAIEYGAKYLVKSIDLYFSKLKKTNPIEKEKLIINKRSELNKYRFIPFEDLNKKKSIQIIKALTWPGVLEPSFTFINNKKIYLSYSNCKKK